MGREEMGERKEKKDTHDLSPSPAMMKEQFWQERTSREVATRQPTKSASRSLFGSPNRQYKQLIDYQCFESTLLYSKQL